VEKTVNMGAAMKRASSKYMMTKLLAAGEEFMAEFASRSSAGVSEALSQATAKFKETYNKQLTSVIVMSGAAMIPSINQEAAANKNAYEKLVIRNLPRPSARSVAVGDIIAFKSPLDVKQEHVMVRRVAASEHTPMISEQDDEESFKIPVGHCWVLADNEELQPPDVIDSRSFGYLPYSSILGRVIYRLRTKADHGILINSVQAAEQDGVLVDEEVDLDKLAENMPSV